jgi:AraC-like DNA-binding protein
MANDLPTRAVTEPQGSRRSWKPAAVLAPFVREFSLNENLLGTTQIYNPLPARSDCFLQIYLADRYTVVTTATGAIHRAPSSVLVGPHTRRREDLIWSGTLRIFTVRFTAVGFRVLFGIPAQEIANVADDARLILGGVTRELEDRLATACDADLAGIAESFLLARVARARGLAGAGIALRATATMRRRAGGSKLDGIAAGEGLSVRQLERIFQQFVGTTPRMYGRLARVKRVLSLANAHATPDWAGIAAVAGYFDQSHLIRDFRELNGATPVEFHALTQRAREFRRSSVLLRTRNRRADVAFVLSPQPAARVSSI